MGIWGLVAGEHSANLYESAGDQKENMSATMEPSGQAPIHSTAMLEDRGKLLPEHHQVSAFSLNNSSLFIPSFPSFNSQLGIGLEFRSQTEN